MAPHVDRENVVVEGQSNNSTSKEHIALHLVSNVLDDEAPEESTVKDSMASSTQTSQLPNAYGIVMSEKIDSWQSSANFSLPLSSDKTSDERSINNKSIQEIWSPDASPNGLNNLSPGDEVLDTYQTQQLLDSPSSIIDNTELSFEQVQNEINATTFTPGRIQSVDEIGEENGEDSNQQSLNYNCYQNIPSSVYNPYSYGSNNTSYGNSYSTDVANDTYRGMFMQGSEMMMNNETNPLVVDQNDYFGTYCFDNNYQYVGDNNGYNLKKQNSYEQVHQQPVHMNYDLNTSFMEELGICIDECRDQLKHLERDYRKADASLIEEFRLRRSSGSESGNLKYPPNSTRVDKLIIDEQKEHQKVESLIGRIERLGFTPMHPNVGIALDLWLTGIKDLRNVRKNELANLSELPYLHNGSRSHLQGDTCHLITCVKELTKHTRSARTIVWCALQMLYASMPGGSGSGE